MNNQSQEKKRYEAPHLTVVSVKQERGYSASTQSFALGVWMSSLESDYGMQDYNLQTEYSWI